MKVGIFYISLDPGGVRQFRQRIETGLGTPPVYIRVQTVDAASLEDALDQAEPENDEDLMNSHEIQL